MFKKGITPKSEMKAVPYTKEEFEGIVSSLDIRLSEKCKEELKAKLNLTKVAWDANRHFLKERIPTIEQSMGDYGNRMSELKIKANDLIGALENYGYLLESPLAPLENRFIEKEKIAKRLERLVDDLRCLAIDAESAEEKYNKASGRKIIKDKGGRTRDVYRQFFISRLAEIFKDITGKEAKIPGKYLRRKNNVFVREYNNPFMRFVEACITPIEKIGNTGLAKAIGATFKNIINDTTKI